MVSWQFQIWVLNKTLYVVANSGLMIKSTQHWGIEFTYHDFTGKWLKLKPSCNCPKFCNHFFCLCVESFGVKSKINCKAEVSLQLANLLHSFDVHFFLWEMKNQKYWLMMLKTQHIVPSRVCQSTDNCTRREQKY